MRIIVLGKEVFKSKKTGLEWVKIPYILESGSIGHVLLSSEVYSSYGFDESKILNKEDLATLFKEYKTAEVSFNERGRVVSFS